MRTRGGVFKGNFDPSPCKTPLTMSCTVDQATNMTAQTVFSCEWFAPEPRKRVSYSRAWYETATHFDSFIHPNRNFRSRLTKA
jgi:hypothetical protein